MPKSPRFSASLSPEAQFAMMKGYEDAVYGYLCTSYPDLKGSLKRTRTPVNPVDIKDVPRQEKSKNDRDGPASSRPESSASSSSSSALSRSTSVYNIRPGTGRSAKLSRTESMPSLVPLHKQLILTHRLQSAMDILDTVKTGMGMHAISPRIKTNTRECNPVKDYNSWTRIWNTEFQISKTKAWNDEMYHEYNVCNPTGLVTRQWDWSFFIRKSLDELLHSGYTFTFVLFYVVM